MSLRNRSSGAEHAEPSAQAHSTARGRGTTGLDRLLHRVYTFAGGKRNGRIIIAAFVAMQIAIIPLAVYSTRMYFRTNRLSIQLASATRDAQRLAHEVDHLQESLHHEHAVSTLLRREQEVLQLAHHANPSEMKEAVDKIIQDKERMRQLLEKDGRYTPIPEHTAPADQRKHWMEVTLQRNREERESCDKYKAQPCPRTQEEAGRVLDSLEEFYGALAPNVRDLILVDRPLSAREQSVFERLESRDRGFDRGPVGQGRLCIPYPRLNRFLARLIVQMPNVYSGTIGDDAKERAQRAEALVQQRDREESNMYQVLERLRRSKTRIFIAALLHNSMEIIDNWMDELEKVVSALGPDRVFVSVYESASVDATKAKLAALRARLDSLGIPNRVITDYLSPKVLTSNMFLPIGDERDRIFALARLRNKAMEPLFTDETEGMQFDKVIFLNDVVYRARQIWELLNTKDGEFDLVCGMDRRIDGYDLWVMRDVEGRIFSTVPPYVRHPPSMAKARQNKPYPVYACWNGIAVMNSEPFTKHGIRFRRNYRGECYHSECFLVFEDFQSKGYHRFFINPRVSVTYNPQFFNLNEWLIDRPVVQRAFEALYDPDRIYFTTDEKRRNKNYERFGVTVDCVFFPPWGWPYCI